MTAVAETISMEVLEEGTITMGIIVTAAVIMIGQTIHHPFLLFSNYIFLKQFIDQHLFCIAFIYSYIGKVCSFCRHNFGGRDGDTRHKYGSQSKRSRRESRSRSRSRSPSQSERYLDFNFQFVRCLTSEHIELVSISILKTTCFVKVFCFQFSLLCRFLLKNY